MTQKTKGLLFSVGVIVVFVVWLALSLLGVV